MKISIVYFLVEVSGEEPQSCRRLSTATWEICVILTQAYADVPLSLCKLGEVFSFRYIFGENRGSSLYTQLQYCWPVTRLRHRRTG